MGGRAKRLEEGSQDEEVGDNAGFSFEATIPGIQSWQGKAVVAKVLAGCVLVLEGGLVGLWSNGSAGQEWNR